MTLSLTISVRFTASEVAMRMRIVQTRRTSFDLETRMGVFLVVDGSTRVVWCPGRGSWTCILVNGWLYGLGRERLGAVQASTSLWAIRNRSIQWWVELCWSSVLTLWYLDHCAMFVEASERWFRDCWSDFWHWRMKLVRCRGCDKIKNLNRQYDQDIDRIDV